VLIKSVLESIHVYWNSIATILKGILDKVIGSASNISGWAKKTLEECISSVGILSSLPRISADGGLKKFTFLRRPSWEEIYGRLTQNNSLWVKVMCSKYMVSLSVADWFRTPVKYSKGSIIWKAMVEDFPLVGVWTIWKIGSGHCIRVEEDSWLGAG
jgi:hypothetical protein